MIMIIFFIIKNVLYSTPIIKLIIIIIIIIINQKCILFNTVIKLLTLSTNFSDIILFYICNKVIEIIIMMISIS